MVREAVAVGIPAYSFFLGKLGALEARMIKGGHILKISSEADFAKIKIEKHILPEVTRPIETLNTIIYRKLALKIG